MSDDLARRTDEGLTAFAEAVFATPSWIETLRVLDARPDWPARREALLRDAEVDACVRSLPPKERCVIEQQLRSLGRTGDADAIARLAHIADAHPQLRVCALHGLLEAGPLGVEAAAGPPGQAPPGVAEALVGELRARAALLRGDPPEIAARGDAQRRRAALRAYGFILGEERRGRGDARSARVVADDRWLAFTIDAYFDDGLAETADGVLYSIPQTRWKPLVAARKKATKTKKSATKKPSAREIAALDAELKAMRAALEVIVRELKSAKYAFASKTPLAKKPTAITAKLKRLEKRVGHVPLALARFWAIVGAVDLRGNHPAWKKKTYVDRGDDPHWYADPLAVTSVDAALVDAEESDFDVAEAPTSLRYALDLAGDDVTKANFSGGIVGIETPSDVIDPPLRGREGTFLAMLRESIAWNGFPGFAKIDDAPISSAHSPRSLPSAVRSLRSEHGIASSNGATSRTVTRPPGNRP